MIVVCDFTTVRQRGRHDHGYGRSKREIFREIDNPDGTVLLLGSVITDQQTGETRVRLGASEPKSDDQVVKDEGEALLRIARPVSEALNGSTIELVETLKCPALSLKPPYEELPMTDGS